MARQLVESVDPAAAGKIAEALSARGIRFEVRISPVCACAPSAPPAAIWILEDGDMDWARSVVADVEKGVA